MVQTSTDFAHREFLIGPVTKSRSAGSSTQRRRSTASRHIKQLQYISWPDHDIPANPSDLIRFVEQVREARGSNPAPVVVHCSAGIGRTGVLISLETAMNLIEREHPVQPIEMVQQMRSQRAMLIQTIVSSLPCVLASYNYKIAQQAFYIIVRALILIAFTDWAVPCCIWAR